MINELKKNSHNLAINEFRTIAAQFWFFSVYLFQVLARLTTLLFVLFLCEEYDYFPLILKYSFNKSRKKE